MDWALRPRNTGNGHVRDKIHQGFAEEATDRLNICRGSWPARVFAADKSTQQRLIEMKRLNPAKLHVIDLTATDSGTDKLPRRYTLTHSDITGELYLTVGADYDKKRRSKLYTRLMRDEVLAELVNNEGCLELRVYCHVSGGLVLGTAKWRSDIFHTELPLVLEAIRYGDRNFYETDPSPDQAPVKVYFHSHNSRYNQVENWGVIADYG